ncbi:MAG: hypothetical protein B6I20_09335 [Bacteroidetes bacterium 4572_117]|nr:MAG: hypothetical protein B6I20_09335 [Bacteroidetes bacterium 4572_117]
MKTKKHLSSSIFNKMNKLLILAISISLLGLSSCKTKKKVADTEKDVVEVVNPDIAKSKLALYKLLNDDGTMTIEEKEKIVNDIKNLGLDDEELNKLIARVDEKIAIEKEELEKKKEAAKPENMLKSYFTKIASAPNKDDANKQITEALKMFSSDKSNVLVIIAEEGGEKDYDEPTNISSYLNYLKDTKNNTNTVDEIKWDANNKIKTLILRKN